MLEAHTYQENQADCASRGKIRNEIGNKTLWWNGPSWLSQDKDKWPERNFVCLEVRPEENKNIPIAFTEVHSEQNLIEITRFSGFSKLIRVAAWVMKIVTKLKKKELKRSYHQMIWLMLN